MSGLISLKDLRRACLAAATNKRVEKELGQCFQLQAPAFYLDYNKLGFYTGVDKETWECHFLLSLEAAQQLVEELEGQLSCDLTTAQQAIEAAPQHNWAKYDSIQAINIPTEAMYNAIDKSFSKLSKQCKSQALYSECRLMLLDARSMAQPLHKQQLQVHRGPDGPQAVMFLALDIEWWEKSNEYILEVGYSLWDTVTQRHRTKHWIIRENFNKCNGRFITDNRMRFLFGNSEKSSLDKAMDALQKEVDNLGVTDGLDRQEQAKLCQAGVKLVLIGHGMNQDMEHVEGEIEWPADMPIMDAQKLYLAHQLRKLDAASAAKALREAVAQINKTEDVAEPLLEDKKDLGLESDSDEEEYLMRWPAVDDDDDTGGRGKGSKGGKNGTAVDTRGLILVKTVQQQLPKKVRPWPAGPGPEDEKPALDEAPQSDKEKNKDKIDRQISLSGLLGALGIKYSKLHNAGNDARFTMEAFLAMAGHPVCTDPVQAHLDSLTNNVRYQKGIEESMLAAAAQGWGSPASHGKGNSPASTNGATTPIGGVAPGAAAVASKLSRLALGSAQGSGPSSTANCSDDCGSASSAECMIPPPGWGHSRHSSGAPPGFSAAADDDDVPPGFPSSNNRGSAAAAGAASSGPWAANNGANGAGVTSSTGSWGNGPPKRPTTGPWAAAAGAAAGAAASCSAQPGTAWGRSAPPAAPAPIARAAPAKPANGSWSNQPKKPGGSGWGSAHNSSVDIAHETPGYKPNPDGW